MRHYIKSSYLHPDFDTAYKWDQEEIRDDVWFDCNNKQFLSFDEVLSIAGESIGLYRLQAKHEANYDIDNFIDKYLYGKNIYPYWFDEVIDAVISDFENSSSGYDEYETDPLEVIKSFVYENYGGVTAKVKRELSVDSDWWFNEIINQADVDFTDDEDWSQDGMLAHGRKLYSTYGPGDFDDMTDYDWECHQLYQRSFK